MCVCLKPAKKKKKKMLIKYQYNCCIVLNTALVMNNNELPPEMAENGELALWCGAHVFLYIIGRSLHGQCDTTTSHTSLPARVVADRALPRSSPTERPEQKHPNAHLTSHRHAMIL